MEYRKAKAFSTELWIEHVHFGSIDTAMCSHDNSTSWFSNSVKGTLYEAVDTKMENRRLEKAKIANEDVKAPLLDEVV